MLEVEYKNMAKRNIDSKELRSLSMPDAKFGYDKEIVDTVISGCADTISDLEQQIEELNTALSYLRAQSAPLEVNRQDQFTDDDDDSMLAWLNDLDPLKIDQEVQRTIAEAIVGSTMAASHIRAEAKERVKILIDAVAVEVKKLVELVRKSKTSNVLITELPKALSAWEGEFRFNISSLLSQLELPWTVQVSQLAKVLNHMSENQIGEIDKKQNKSSHSVRAQKPTQKNDSKTTKGQWD